MSDYQALLLVSFGGPEQAQDVVPFLSRVTAGRPIPPERIEAVAGHYYASGGRSPVNEQCRALLANLARALDGLGLKLYWGNRNWHPLLEATVAEMRDAGVTKALAFVTSAYGGYSSCRQYQDDIAAARAKAGPGAPTVHKLRLYYNHPGWVGPWVASLNDALKRARAGQAQPHVVFCAHSIPQASAATSPYVEHVTASASLVAQQAGVRRWDLAWQSRSGSPSQPWLGPDINDVLRTTTASSVVVVPIGFACDNMEIVYDLDIEAADIATNRGIELVRAATVATTEPFAHMVRQLALERLSPATANRFAVGPDGPWPDECPPGHCPGRALPPST